MIMIIIMVINIITDRFIETPVDAHMLNDRWVPQEGVKSSSRLRDSKGLWNSPKCVQLWNRIGEEYYN